MKKSKIEIVYRSTDEIYELMNNPRKITREQMKKLEQSIRDNPDYFEARPIILSDRTGKMVIIAGNQRVRAAAAIGMTEVPTVLLSGLSEEREREIIIRDNVSNGDWDYDVLASDWAIEDLQEWGVPEIKPYKDIEEVAPAPIDDTNISSVVGSIYQLGDHRLLCGSFEDAKKVRQLFEGKKAICCFTDPPYNINYHSADGKSIKNDHMQEDDFKGFLDRAFACVAENIVAGGGRD